MNNNHTIFCFIGRTASGKSSIIKQVAKDLDLYQVKSFTTREQRPTELIESDHIFIKEEDIEEYRDDIVAYTEIGKDKYFCTRAQVMNCDLYTIDPIGLESLRKQHIEGLTIIPIYISARLDVRTGRFLGRGNSIDEFIERNKKEDEQFSEFEKSQQYAIKIDNSDSIEDAVMECEAFVIANLED